MWHEVWQLGSMDKAARAKLLRQLHPAPPIEPVEKKHRERRPDYVNPGLNWRGRYGIQLVFRLKQWVTKPDRVKLAVTPQTRRVARKSPLMRIAELYPVRLPRRHD